jgi:hypothetical protein
VAGGRPRVGAAQRPQEDAARGHQAGLALDIDVDRASGLDDCGRRLPAARGRACKLQVPGSWTCARQACCLFVSSTRKLKRTGTALERRQRGRGRGPESTAAPPALAEREGAERGHLQWSHTPSAWPLRKGAGKGPLFGGLPDEESMVPRWTELCRAKRVKSADCSKTETSVTYPPYNFEKDRQDSLSNRKNYIHTA